MHLAGIKSETLSATAFYEACEKQIIKEKIVNQEEIQILCMQKQLLWNRC